MDFFTDVFRVRHTIHAEVFAQVALAFVIGWAAQLAKLWRCGGEVQEAFECPVTFEPYAHSVVGSVLAFMIVYRFKFARRRYYEAKTAIGELHCGLRNFNIGACVFARRARGRARTRSRRRRGRASPSGSASPRTHRTSPTFGVAVSVFSDSFSASSASGTRTIDARAIDNC